MIMSGMEYMGERPFSDVYFTGMVRDKQGRKMSKSLGNSPDLLQMIDKSGADAVRFGIMVSSPAGNDLLFDDSSLEQGRNFNNKLWNALKLIKMWSERQSDSSDAGTHSSSDFAVRWFQSRLAKARVEVEKLMAGFKLSEALKTIYSLIWDDFCSWYLEWVKPGFEQDIDKSVYLKTVEFYTELLQLLHPYMPFITEEIYHQLAERDDDLCIRQFGSVGQTVPNILQSGALLKDLITGLRDARNKNQLKPKEPVQLYIQTATQQLYGSIQSILARQVNASEIIFTSQAVTPSIAVVIGKEKFYIVSEQPVDTKNQKEELLKELEYLQGFLVSVDKKLSNERFVQNAKPEVVAIEQKKKADAQTKIKVIKESLASL
jgi:valyl-tRNA synthetase